MGLDGRPGASGRPSPDDAPADGAVPDPRAAGSAAFGHRPSGRFAPGRRRTVVAALAALLAALAVVLAPGAQAHDQLVTSEPFDGQVLHAAPDEVVLTLSSEVVQLSGEVELVLPDGGRVDDLETTVDGPTVRAEMPDDLVPGEYGVVWTVRCFDGHTVEGSFGFAVSPPPQRVPPGTTTVDDVASLTSTGADEEGAVVSTDVAAVWPVLVGAAAVLTVAGTAWLLVRRYR